MIYITVKQPPQYHQMTLEEFLFGSTVIDQLINSNVTNTRTYEVGYVSERFYQFVDVNKLIEKLKVFNEQNAELMSKPRHSLYKEFHIPKKSGGLRKIDAPEPELMDALRRLKTIFEEDFHTLYHTSAFAYVKGRSVVDCLKRHQENESKWYGKYDLSNFFGSTTLDFVMKMFSMIFPFSEVVKTADGRKALSTALELAFLDGGLPQGTPISPTITNIMMIPIDFNLAREFGEHNHQRFVYTRYADDFQISSKYSFSFRDVENVFKKTLEAFGAPFQINSTKTRYGSSAVRNWNLGLLITKENKLSVGSKKKRQFQAMLFSFIMDKRNGIQWSKGDIQVMEGYRNWFMNVEPETISGMVAHINQKFGVDVVRMIKEELRS